MMKKGQLFISFLVALCLFALLPAYGEEVLRGNVINVVDGDTLDVQVGPGKYRIRLAEIDAPERNQPWGDEAKQVLTSKVLKQEVRVVVTERSAAEIQIKLEVKLQQFLLPEAH